MPRHHGSEIAEIRRAANRLAELEVLSSFTPDDDARPTEYVAVTTAGEIVTVTRSCALPFLRGLGMGVLVGRQLERADPS